MSRRSDFADISGLTSDDIPDPADTPRDMARLAEQQAKDHPWEDSRRWLDEQRWTVIGRVAERDGTGIEVRWPDLTLAESVEVVSRSHRSLEDAFIKTFGREPDVIDVFRFPYLESVDTDDS